MQFIANSNIIHLKDTVRINRYLCDYAYKTDTVTFYFTNIINSNDIYGKNFTVLYKDSTNVVLGLDLINPDRTSVLGYIPFLDNEQPPQFQGIKQRCLMEYFQVTNSSAVLFYRDAPEIFDNTAWDMQIIFDTMNIYCGRTCRIEYHEPSDTPSGLSKFVLYGEYQGNVYHPKTTFVIDEDNIIIFPESYQITHIGEFLNNDVKSRVSLLPLPETNYEQILWETLQKYHDPNDKYLKHIILGYGYKDTVHIREMISKYRKDTFAVI